MRSEGGRAAVFGEVLVRFRRAAGLTQEGLAEASGMSVRALRDVERGRTRTVQRRSAEVLADALRLAGEDRAEFLAAARERRRRTAPPTPAPSTLPPALRDLVGRSGELGRLRGLAAVGGTVAVVGHPGVGKTALATWAVHELGAEFPDGRVWVDLRGMDDQPVTSRAALERLLRALGVPASEVPAVEEDRAVRYRSALVGRRVLVVLDNAADEVQVRPLLATVPGCATLVTCRRALAGLEGARWEWLGPLTDADAVALLGSIVGVDRVEAEPEAAAELVGLCGNLPLAVRIVGNRLATRRHWSLGYLVELLGDERTRLSSLSVGDLQVRSAFEVSYRRLAPGARMVFRRLAAVPGADFGVGLAEVATGLTGPETLVYLDELADASLSQATLVEGRFQFHDLLRLFAVERWEAEESPAERERVSHVVLEHLLAMASAAGRVFFPGAKGHGEFSSEIDAGEWLVREETNWVAAQRAAARLGWHREVLELATALHWYSGHQWLRLPWVEIFRLGVDAARALGDRSGEAEALNLEGWAVGGCLGDLETSLTIHRQALAVAVEAGVRVEEVWANAYVSTLLRHLGQLEEALDHVRRACVLAEEFDFWAVQVPIRHRLGQILHTLGRYEEALSAYQAVLADAHRYKTAELSATQRMAVAFFKEGIGHCLIVMGESELAAETLRETRRMHVELGSSGNAANAALNEGKAWLAAGEHARARECLEYALDAYGGDQAPPDRRAQVLTELARLPVE